MSEITLTADHEYLFNGVVYPSVTTILREEGIINTEFYNEAGAARGQEVHEMTAMLDSGLAELRDFEQFDELMPYLEAFEWFRTDHRWEPQEIELKFVSPKGYAGTIDRIALLDGDPVLADFKSGSHQRWHGLQLAAYAEGIAMNDIQRRIVLLKKDGKYSILEGHRTIGDFADDVWSRTWNGILVSHLWKKGVFA